MTLRTSPHPIRDRVRRSCALAALVLTGGWRADANPLDFTDLSLEELHAVSVSAASKHAQPLFETPAAVSVLLPVDFSRAGSSSVADALRLVPGVHVVEQQPGRSSIGVRGGNGVQSTKLLVLVDGRSVYSPFYGSVEWPNAEIDVTDLARIEVVRGPGATLWGANAVNGVVNVLSKDARETQGGILALRAGTGQMSQARLRYGGRLNETTWYRVYFGQTHSEGALGALGDDPMSRYREYRAGFRTDSFLGDSVQLTTQFEHLENARPEPGSRSEHALDSVLTRLTLRDTAAGEFRLQLYFDRTRDRMNGADGGGQNSLPFALDGETDNADLDFTHHLRTTGRHDIIWGGGIRYTDDQTGSTLNLRLAHPRRESWLYNLFAQDQITLWPDTLRLTLGTKLEHHDEVGWELLPNVRLTWFPRETHMAWVAVSRAIRAPSRAEREVKLTFSEFPATPTTPPVRLDLSGNPDFQPEDLLAYEAGWRWQPNARFQADATAYAFDYSDVRSLSLVQSIEPGMPPTVVQTLLLGNETTATTRGAELAWQWRVSDAWEVGGAVARAQASVDTAMPNLLVDADYAVPEWIWHLRSWWQLPRDWEFSSTLYGVGEIDRTDTPGYLRLDLQGLWRPRPDLEFSIGVQNATDSRHNESMTSQLRPSTDVRRNVYLRVQWRF